MSKKNGGHPNHLTYYVGGPVLPVGGGNSNFLFGLSPPKFGDIIQFDEHMFQMGGEKPPTRNLRTWEEMVFLLAVDGWNPITSWGW